MSLIDKPILFSLIIFIKSSIVKRLILLKSTILNCLCKFIKFFGPFPIDKIFINFSKKGFLLLVSSLKMLLLFF